MSTLFHKYISRKITSYSLFDPHTNLATRAEEASFCSRPYLDHSKGSVILEAESDLDIYLLSIQAAM